MLKVLLKFSDRYDSTREFYPGDLIEVEDRNREKDLLERGIAVEAVPFILKNPSNLKKEKTETTDEVSTLDADEDYSKMSVKEIKNILNEKGIEYDPKAKKEELISLLEE